MAILVNNYVSINKIGNSVIARKKSRPVLRRDFKVRPETRIIESPSGARDLHKHFRTEILDAFRFFDEVSVRFKIWDGGKNNLKFMRGV